MNALKQIETPEFTPLAKAIGTLTGDPAGEYNALEVGPGTIFVLELPSRKILHVSPKNKDFPESFYNLAKSTDTWDEMVASEDRDQYARSWTETPDDGEVRYKVTTSRRGNSTPVYEYRTLLHNSEGEVAGAVCRIVDDSFRAMSMDALARRSWKEVATLMTRRLLHDFNNTIAGIYSLSELYAEPGSDAESMTEAMVHIRNSAMRSQEITKKIRLLNTLEPGEASYSNLGTLVRDQDDYLQTLFPKHARIEYQIEDEQIPVYLDASQFRQAILHLASNSLDAAKDDLEIRIQVTGTDHSGKPGMARIDFSDNGHGVNAADIGSLLDPFFTTKDKMKHPGLGLNIVKAFVEELGGSVEIAAQETGTKVSLFVPVAEVGQSSASATKKSAKPKEPKPEEDATPEIILYTWEDISRHPLLLAMKKAGWELRVHLDPGELLIDLSCSGPELSGVLVFKSALDEKAEPLLSELGFAKNSPKIGVIAIGDSVDALPDSIGKHCGLVVSGSSKPTALLNKLAKFYK